MKTYKVIMTLMAATLAVGAVFATKDSTVGDPKIWVKTVPDGACVDIACTTVQRPNAPQCSINPGPYYLTAANCTNDIIIPPTVPVYSRINN